MTWLNLLFLHWRFEPAAIRPFIPQELELDTFDGSAWVGLVPFKMHNCEFAGFGWVPTLRNFYECNVRTYVTCNGRPGVWFFSLDAQNLLPVLGGRWLWNLNYVYSRFTVRDNCADNQSFSPHADHKKKPTHDKPANVAQTHEGQIHDYALRRRPGPWPNAHTHIRWTVNIPLPRAQPGSLEYFLTERYCLYTKRRSRIMVGRIHHNPWQLHAATLHHLNDTLVHAASVGTITTNTPPHSALASPSIIVTGDPLRVVCET